MVTTISGASAPTKVNEKEALLDAIDRFISLNSDMHSGQATLKANGKVYTGQLVNAATVREFIIGSVVDAPKAAPAAKSAAKKSAPKKGVSSGQTATKRKR